ncbi:hypothetical protein DLM77_06885 [Leptospira yasudae]|uniref:Uncharacterized protein n=1 Tax=Leptospira yasudae TaxID=2202201 RepID=A0ABX9M574_9LEPT|nr:hypothetical protein DLM77_06885 [Leptospira yasudae]
MYSPRFCNNGLLYLLLAKEFPIRYSIDTIKRIIPTPKNRTSLNNGFISETLSSISLGPSFLSEIRVASSNGVYVFKKFTELLFRHQNKKYGTLMAEKFECSNLISPNVSR